jgi:hypothetical protein
MNQSDSDRIQELCCQIAVELDRQEFLKLVQELNRLLSAKDGRLQDNEPIDRMDEYSRAPTRLSVAWYCCKNNIG